MKKETIIVNAREVKSEKNTFLVYSTQIKEKWYNVKFTKLCNDYPKVKGVHYITFDLSNCSLQAGNTFLDRNGRICRGNDILWISKIESSRPESEEEQNAKKVKKLEEVFGTEIETNLDF